MKRAFLLMPLLLALTSLLSACSAQSLLPSATLVSSTPTPAPTALPTAPPVDQSSANSFDNGAGNCLDAANQAISLLTGAANAQFGGTSFNMDMHLDLEPHGPTSGCADSPAHIGMYRKYVSLATLSVWPLDSLWYNEGSAVRQQWLADVLNTLLHLYPRAQISIQVSYNGASCGSATIGPGSGRTIDPSC